MAEPAVRAPLVRGVRRLLVGVGAGVAVLLVLLHTPWVESRVAGWALESLRAFDVEARAEHVRYNLLTLHVRAEGVTLARSTSPSEPFARLQAVDITVPWSALQGRLSIASIQLDRARVTLVRRADGSANWPTSSANAGGLHPSSFPIGRLAARDLALAWHDEITGTALEIEGANLDLGSGPRGAAGALRLDRPARYVQRGHETAIAARAQVAWDGARLTIDSLRLDSPEAALSAGGAIDLLSDRPLIALDYEGQLRLAALAPWLAIDPRPAGTLDLRGRVAGALTDPRAEAAVKSASIEWRGLAASSLDVAMKIDVRGADIDRASISGAGGVVQARGRLSFDDGGGASLATIEWQGIDGDLLLRALRAAPAPLMAARIDGRATASWGVWRVSAVRASAEATTRAGRPQDGRIGLEGSVSLKAGDGNWRATVEQSFDQEALHLQGEVGGRLSDTAGQTTIAGRVAAVADNGDRLWRLLQKLAVAPAKSPRVVAGRARVDLVVSGTLADPAATVDATVAGWQQGPIAPLEADAHITVTTRAVVADTIAARIGANSVRARGSVSFADGRIEGLLNASAGALDELLPGASRDFRPSGTLEASATIAGRVSSPVVNSRVTGRQLIVAGQQAEHLEASFALAGNVARLERFELSQPDGLFSAGGSYNLATRTIAGTVNVRNIAVFPIAGARPVPVRARVDAHGTIAGVVDDPHGEAQVELRNARLDERDLGAISGTLTLASHRLAAVLRMPDLFASATASLALQPSGPFVADVQMTDGDLAALTSRLAVPTAAPVTGQTTLGAHVEGRRGQLARSHVTFDLRRLDARVGEVPVRATHAAHATYDGASLDVGGLAIDVGGAQLRVEGRLDRAGAGRITGSLDGTLRDLGRVALTFGHRRETPELDGRVIAVANMTGPIDRPSIDATVRLDDGRAAVGRFPPATGISVRASYGAGVLNLSQLTGAWQGATVSASGRAPITFLGDRLPAFLLPPSPHAAGVARFDARLESLTPATLAPWVPPETLDQLAGLLTGTLTVEAGAPSISGVRAQLVLDHAEVTLAGVKLEELRPTRIELAGGRLAIVDWEWGQAENRVSLSGGVRLAEPSALDVSARGALDLRALGAFVPQVSTAGRAALEAHVSGSLDAPRIDGRVDLRDGEVRAGALGLAASDIAGTIVLAGDEIVVPDVYGNANGGTLTLAGRARYADGRWRSGRFAITARGLAMAVPQDLKTEIDADLSLGVANGDLSLGGDVTVLRGAYREPLLFARGLVHSLQRSAVTIDTVPSSAVDRMAMSVRITTADDILVDNNYAQMALSGDVRVEGTPTQPTLLGRVRAREGGRIFLGGNVYRLERDGTVDFANPAVIEPDVDITAVTRVAGQDVNLSLKGPATRLETSLTAPGSTLTEGQVAVLLATGSPPAQGAAVPAIGADQLLAYVSGEFLGTAGRAIGIDTLRLEQGSPDVRFDAGLIATETDPGSRLTFGKQVTREFEVVFSKNLKDTGTFIWIVGYRPRANIEIRVVSEENNDRVYDFRHDITIGGGRATAAPPPAQPRVAAIRFTGASGLSVNELHGRLALTEGKRFDFYGWQQDRERLETMCRERGRLEGRVTARRSSVEGDGGPVIDLEYEVRCGPVTEIDITGARNESRLRRAIEGAWSRSVFDTFLVDEVRTAARADLVRDGYVQAAVGASMDSGDDRKRLVVSIEPGPHFDRRRVLFTGSERIATARLEALISAQRVDDKAWVDPAPLARAVTAFYRDDGFLAARVEVGRPVFDGATATLPVTIDEGPPFRIARIDVRGTNDPDVLSVAGVRPGDVLTHAAMDRAAGAIESHYRSKGFGYVRVAMASRSDAASESVALTVTVDEGARQVLRDVTIEGMRRTSEAFVSRELRFDVGQPVNLADWAQARKRLFDTGAYRLVDLDVVPMTDGSPVDRSPTEQPMRARVRLEEWAPLRLRYGFELDDRAATAAESNRFKPGVAADATFHNLFGPASVVLAGRYTSGFRAARGLLTAPSSLLGRPMTSNLFIERSREQIGPSDRRFVADKTGFTAEQRMRLGGALQVAYSYNFARNHTFDVNANPDNPAAFDVTINIARLTATGVRDTRDDLVDATRGQFFSATAEYGASALGSDLHFSKLFVEQSWYRTLRRGLVFATNARLGVAAAYGQELIPSERFFAGGGNSVRGYEESSLGPRDFFGDAAGGNAMLILNEEVRFPIIWWVRGVAFFDAGNAFATAGDLGLGDLRSSAGAGLRVRTPFALFRVDLGAPLGRRPGEPRATWFFSIGQIF